MIPGSVTPLLLKSAAVGGLQIERSLRFNSSDSAYLSRTPGTAGNRTTWTWSGWVKRSKIGNQRFSLFCAGNSGSDETEFFFQQVTGADKLVFYYYPGSYTGFCETLMLFRDTSAWYHIVLALDTTQGTASDRCKIYVNGVQQSTSFTSNFGLSATPNINSTAPHQLGRSPTEALPFDGYLANIHFIDGQALTPSSFTETDATTGQLIPKTYTGSYGTNGFNLLFADNSSNTASTLGKDSSGLGNDWTPNNFSVLGGANTVTIPATNAPPTVDYLVVAGGGAGGAGVGASSSRGGGGGGSGGLLTGAGYSVSSGSTYGIDVGVGGTVTTAQGNNGTNSIFASITAIGGGGGGGQAGGNAASGGSGGGGGAQTDNSTYGLGASGTVGQGNAGANAYTTFPGGGGGGGGAGSAGSVGTSGDGGAGGSGVANSYSGSSVTYAAGGKGGGSTTPVAGGANTGNGGGGRSQSDVAAQNGGSGIVIIRYSNSYADLSVGGGLTYTYANTGGYKIYSFTASTTAAVSAGNDSLVDSPTNYGTDTGVGGEVRGNYCTWNPLYANGTLSNGNLDVSTTTTNSTTGTIFASSGKWYWETTVTTSSFNRIGIVNLAGAGQNLGGTANSWAILHDGQVYTNSTTTAYGPSYGVNDLISIALDIDAGKIWYGKNGTWMASGNPGTGANPSQTFTAGQTMAPAIASGSGTCAYVLNAGQRAFAYTAPSGFKALCTQNLPAPLVTKSNTVMDVALYTGNGGTQTITLPGAFSPDLVWIKCRSVARNHALQDTVRGALQWLGSNLTNAESTDAGSITSFNSNGFTLGSATGYNQSSETHVAWCWDAGTSTVSNTQGSITSQVRANATAGFSVVTYTGNGGSNVSVGHGLGVAPVLLICKSRSASVDWDVTYTFGDGSYDFMSLNTTAAKLDITGRTAPTSTLFYVNGGLSNVNSDTYVCYAFAPVVGYNSFGSYTGNNSTDGPFVYTGFRPRFVLLKASSITSDWFIYDTSRNTYNAAGYYLWPNYSSAEPPYFAGMDILSNGFKMRENAAGGNEVGDYIYAAFAEAPFNYSRAR